MEAHIDDDILGMISADMVAYNSGNDDAYIYGHNASNPLKTSLGEAVTTYGNGLSYSINGAFDASDHAPFEWAGFQACLLIEDVWANPYFHTPYDNVDMPNYIDYDYAVRMTRSVVGYLVDNAGVIVLEPCVGDLDGDQDTDQADLGILLGDWGCTGGDCPGDCDFDGDTDHADLGLLLGHWGEGCP